MGLEVQDGSRYKPPAKLRFEYHIGRLEQLFWISLIIISCILPVSNFFTGQPTSYVPAILIYSTFLIRILLFSSIGFAISKHLLLPLGILVSIYTAHGLLGVLSNSVAPFAKGLAFAFFILVNLFIIPRTINFEIFVDTLSKVLFGIVCIGLLGISTDLGFQAISARNLPYFNISIPVFTSVVHNVNAFGRLAGVGFVASIVSYDISHSKRYLVIGSVLGLGLITTTARSSIIAAVSVLFFYWLYWSGNGHTAINWVLISLVGGICVFASTIFLTLIGTSVPITFSKRNVYWAGAVKVAFNSPILGTGPVDTASYIGNYITGIQRTAHNSFLRAFVTTGVIGGLSFTYLFYSGLCSAVSSVRNSNFYSVTVGKIALFYFIIIELMLSSFSIVGLRLSSVVGAITLGFVVKPTIPDN